MTVLKNIFFVLMLAIPVLFIIVMYIARKKVKRNKKFRKKLLTIIIGSFLINGIIYEVLALNQNDNNTENNTIESSESTKESTVVSSSEEESTNAESKESTSSTSTPKESTNSNQNNTVNNGTTASSSESLGVTSKGYEIKRVDGAIYINGILIANKTYALSSDFYPKNTHKTTTKDTTICTECIDNTAYNAFTKMQSDASSQGLTIWIQSGYRSYSYQVGLYNSYVKRSGKEAADTYSARAGNSEHQTGLSFDLNSVTDAFASTKEGIWVNNNCYKYGFIIRFPNGKDSETGYKYESWHLRYVGVELATKLYNNGDWITLENYLGITSEYTE